MDGKSGMIAPVGVEIELGQKWREVDPRFHRIVEVTGFNEATKKVQVRGIRYGWARLDRFNGKRGGYEYSV